MPTLLPPRSTKNKDSEISPLLVLVATALPVLLVFAEARATGAIEFGPLSPDPALIIPP
jgi:hypothetical protein